MGTIGYFAYRYKRKYYRQVLVGNLSFSETGVGARLASTVPRDPSNLKDWIANKIAMLESAEIYEIDDLEDEVMYPQDGIGAEDVGFNVTYDLEWMFTKPWTYVIDLDNLVFTVNGTIHLKLDNMPPDPNGYCYEFPCRDKHTQVPQEYICSRVNLWPTPNFDPEERQQKYEALQPIVVPATEWGAPNWDELSVSQRFSIEITHYLLHIYSRKLGLAYAPDIRGCIGQTCWSILCASVPALPLFRNNNIDGVKLPLQTLTCSVIWPSGDYAGGPYDQVHSDGPFKYLLRDYYWVRGCLVTLCTHLDDPVYVAHEVEQMVMKMRHDGHSESVGIILSTQMELIVVAVDGSQTRHSPVLDIRATRRGERPGRASDGRLLLTYLLSPPVTVSPLPWRVQSHQPCTIASKSITGLPSEVLHMIIGYADMQTYISLCRVSRVIRSACVANPRVERYTILHKIPRFATVFVARHTDDLTLKTIHLRWKRSRDRDHRQWKLREVSPKELSK